MKNLLENKPIFNLSCPSKTLLFMETKDEVQFYTEQEVKVDYSKSTTNVFNQLLDIYYNEHKSYKKNKIKFINAEHPTTEYTLGLSYQSIVFR